MARGTIINYRNKDILYIDRHGLKGHEIIENIRLANQKGKDYKRNALLSLVDFRDITSDTGLMNFLKSEEQVNEVKQYFIKNAILGVDELKKVLFNVYKFTYR